VDSVVVVRSFFSFCSSLFFSMEASLALRPKVSKSGWVASPWWELFPGRLRSLRGFWVRRDQLPFATAKLLESAFLSRLSHDCSPPLTGSGAFSVPCPFKGTCNPFRLLLLLPRNNDEKVRRPWPSPFPTSFRVFGS